MNLLTKLFNRKAKETKVGGMEDYMSLVRSISRHPSPLR
jgi:hypothetical protein